MFEWDLQRLLFIVPYKVYVPVPTHSLISHCCHGQPIPIATKGLHRLAWIDGDLLRMNTHVRKRLLAMLKPHTSMNHKRSCLFPSVYLRWPRMRCSNWYAIIESLWNVSKLIWGPMHKALMCRACFHWHVVFSIKSSSCLSCVTSRQYYCVVHSKVSFTRREQMDFCFHCSRCALVYKDLFQSGVINGNNSLFWTKQMRRGQEMVNNLYAHW